MQIMVSSWQFDWLTKQCEFLAISKQQLVISIMEEWLGGHAAVPMARDPSAAVQKALEEFIQRHQDEFLPHDPEY
jgi:hypothetical protein